MAGQGVVDLVQFGAGDGPSRDPEFTGDGPAVIA
jgi:hypothetical protein